MGDQSNGMSRSTMGVLAVGTLLISIFVIAALLAFANGLRGDTFDSERPGGSAAAPPAIEEHDSIFDAALGSNELEWQIDALMGQPPDPLSRAPLTPPAVREQSSTVDRIEADAIALDAPVIEMGLEDGGRMEIPNEPDLVAWYDFSGSPGQPGNAVFAGHVSWHDESPSAFADLNLLVADDVIVVHLADGESLQYTITHAYAVEPAEEEALAALQPSAGETLTLITCHGPVDEETREYEKRLIVKAERTM